MFKIVNLIIPTYKARDTLPAALDSLVAQTKKFFIVTIVQDADGEDYTDIIEEYRRRGLKIRHLQMEKNGGPGAARQYGMDKDGLSKFFMFMDADDILNPRAIEILSREAEANNADLIISDFIVDKKGDPGFLMDVDNTPCTWCHGKIYRAEYLRKNNIRFIPELRLNEDSYFNLVATNCTNNKLKVHETTYIWRQNGDSLTRKNGEVGFFVKSWQQYIYSQVRGLNDVIDRIGSIPPELVAATLTNIYTHYMKALSAEIFKQCDEHDFVLAEQTLSTLKENPIIVDAIRSKSFWEYLTRNLNGCEMFENNVIFYKMRFCDWLKKYVIEQI